MAERAAPGSSGAGAHPAPRCAPPASARPFGPLGVGPQDDGQLTAAATQGFDLGPPVHLGALGGEQRLAGQGGAAAGVLNLGLLLQQGVGALAQGRRHGLHQDGGAHGVHGPVGGDQQRRRRLAAHHLQRRQQPALTGPLAAQLRQQDRLALAQFGQARPLGVDGGGVALILQRQTPQILIQPRHLLGGVLGVGAQAAGAQLLLTVLHAQARQLLGGRVGALTDGGRRGRENGQNQEQGAKR